MGGAILSAWLNDQRETALDPRQLFVEDPAPTDEIVDFLSKYDVVPQASVELPCSPELVMLGVKPQIMGGVLSSLAPRIGPTTLVFSIAAGKTLDDLARSLPAGTPIVRAMPNTPVMVEAGMVALIGNSYVSAEQKERLDELLSATGEVAWLDDEAQMDAVTAVSGSGPAYVFYVAECLAKAGVEAGLDEALAMKLAKTTVFGAGKMMTFLEVPPSELRENVTSKGGTTAAALELLMADEGLSKIFGAAVQAAVRRSKELSG